MYYIYSYLREDLSPYYIGKGKDQRAYSKGRNEVRPPKDKTRVQIIKANLTEQEAFELEKLYILMFGRIDNGTGILRNKTDGGEGTSGRVDSEETRRKKSIALTGRTISQATREKFRQNALGKTLSPEARMKLSQKLKGKKPTEYNILVSKSRAKPHRITFRNGESIIVSNIVDWSKENGYHHNGVYNVKCGARKFYRDIIGVELVI